MQQETTISHFAKNFPLPENISKAVYAAYNYAQTINLQTWAAKVAINNVVFPKHTSFVSTRHRGLYFASIQEIINCEVQDSRNKIILTMDDIKLRRKSMFFICTVHAKVNGAPFDTDQIFASHIFNVFFYRKSSDDTWKVVVCDSNWGQNRNLDLEVEINLKRIVFDILKKMQYTDSWLQSNGDDLIQYHGGLNVNTCLTQIGKGVCFTELCLMLSALEMYTRYTHFKASNGEELITELLRVSETLRDNAEKYMEAFYTGDERGAIRALLQKVIPKRTNNNARKNWKLRGGTRKEHERERETRKRKQFDLKLQKVVKHFQKLKL